jgi:predicted TIM-barrel fold metal-dependent hydrolase
MHPYDELVEFMESLEIIDTHEHLPNEDFRIREHVDFASLFLHYSANDLVSAGMSQEGVEKLRGGKLGIEDKWPLFSRYYEKTKTGSYARSVHIAMKKFYGMDGLKSLSDARDLTQRVQEANREGLYTKVLKDACKIKTALNNAGLKVDRRFFTPVFFVSRFADVSSFQQLSDIESLCGAQVTSLRQYVDAVATTLARMKEEGLKGFKFHFAYMRPLLFRPVPTAEAEKLFDRIFEEAQGWRQSGLGFEESVPLQDYMVHRLIEMATELDITVVFHTGIQAGNYNNPDNCRPTRLWNLFRRYRKARFDIFHGGLPWVDETALLGKYFDNVYIDMSWMHVISQEISVRALRNWVDMVPMNKVLGFGGDYRIVENVYGHLVMARENIARALSDKVDMCHMSLDEAKAWAEAILVDNPIQAYKLELD